MLLVVSFALDARPMMEMPRRASEKSENPEKL